MIIKGNSRSAGAWWAGHLMRADTNERVEVVEISGLGAQNIRDGFSEMEAIASGTHCTNYAYIVSLNPREHEHLTREQWLWAVDRTAQELGLAGQPRMIVQHDKEGRQHWHVVFSRIDADSMTAISDSLTYPKHERAARAIEQELELEPVPSVLVKDRDTPRPERRPRDYEGFRAQQSGIDPHEVKAEVTAIWNAADSGLAFRAALEDAGYILAKGDRRDFVIVDSAGDEHSLARRISGVKAAEIRARLSDIDRDGLPGVDEAREQARAETDEGSKPTSTDTGEREQQAQSPLDERQAADFLIEPDTRLEGTELAARFGDSYAPSEPGAQSRAEESIPGARVTDAADGEELAVRSHEADERPRRVTPWGFAGLAEQLTRYADLFWDFVHDEQSSQRQEPQAEPPPDEQRVPAMPAEPEAPRGWVARIFEAGKHALHGWKHHDSHELREGVEEAAAIARDLLRRKETPPPDEPKRDMARPGGGNVEPPEPDAEPRAGPQAAAKEAAPVSPPVHLERFASRARGHAAYDDHAPSLGRFQTRSTAAQTPPQQATPEPEPPEPDFD